MRKRLFLLVFTVVAVLLFDVTGIAAPTTTQIAVPNHPPAIILFIGDGMGEAHRTAGRWASVGQDGQLNMDSLATSGWSMTSNASGELTDSAAAATAMATGVKTFNGRLSINTSGESLPTILEQAQEKGWSVGLVSTTQIAHATPAAFATHVLTRSNYTEIAYQLLTQNVNVLLAGGEDDWLPDTELGCHPNLGHRPDGRNLISEAQNNGYTYVCQPLELLAVDPQNTTHLLGLFADDGMLRPFLPGLGLMTEIAIEILSQDPDGFFLMVEGGQIDWAAHANDAEHVINDILGFDAAIYKGVDYASTNPNVLLIVTADHETGGMSLSLDPTGNINEDGPFFMPDSTPFYVNWTTSGHTGVDIPTTAQGKLSDQLSGSYENTQIYEVMRQILGWQVILPLISK